MRDHLDAPRGRGRLDRQGPRAVEQHAIADADPPGRSQRAQSRGPARCARRQAAGSGRERHVTRRIEQDQRPPGREQKLLDRKALRDGELARMGDQQGVEIGGELGEIRLNPRDVEGFIQGPPDRITRPLWIARKAARTAVERQTGQHADARRRRVFQHAQHPGDLIFEIRLARRVELSDRRRLIERIAPDQAKIDRIAAVIGRDWLQALGNGLVFLLGKRRGVDLGQPHLGAALCGDRRQQFAHPRAIGADRREIGRAGGGIIQRQLDRLGEVGDRRLRAFGQGEQAVFGEIEPRRRQQPIGRHDAADKGRQSRQPDRPRIGRRSHRS